MAAEAISRVLWGKANSVIASEAKQSPGYEELIFCNKIQPGDCFVALPAPRNDKTEIASSLRSSQ
jgi:hypothetical protein